MIGFNLFPDPGKTVSRLLNFIISQMPVLGSWVKMNYLSGNDRRFKLHIWVSARYFQKSKAPSRRYSLPTEL
jgi:hypothetical protein